MGVEGLAAMAFDFNHIFKVLIPEQHGLVAKKIAFDGYNGMVMKTAVDLGRARANWSIRIGSPRQDYDDKTDKQPIGSMPGSQMVEAAATINGAESGKAIYATNALPYILALEEGHSKQGAHMVEATVMEIKSHYGI